MIKIFILFVIIFLIGSWPAAGQSDISEITTTSSLSKKEYLSETWTTKNGLPVNHINQVYQTPDGYLWLATFTGLLRFDGIDFEEFNSGNSKNLLSNRLLMIQEGIGNEFWLTTEQNDLIYSENGKFRWFEEFRNDQEYKILVEHETSTTWIGSNSGLYNYTDGKITPVRPDLFADTFITNIYRSRNKELWVFTNHGKAYRFKSGEIEERPTVIDVIPGIRTVSVDKDGKMWVGRNELGYIEDNRFNKVEIAQELLNKWTQYSPLVFRLYSGSGNSVLVSSVLGLLRIEELQLTPIDLDNQQDYKSMAAIGGNELSVCPDGSTWAIINNRVYKNGNSEFTTQYDAETIYCDFENNIWVTTYRDGLYRYRSSLFEYITFPHSDNNFYGVFTDSYDGIWIGKMYGGLNRIDSNGNIDVTATPPGWATTAAITELSDSSVIVGNQLCLPENRTETGLCSSFSMIEPLRNKNIKVVYEDSKNNIWVGTKNGLLRLRFDEAGGESIILKEEIKESPVRYMLETDEGVLWYATNGGGVVRQNETEKVRFHIENGLSSNNVRALYQDETGFVWVGTEDRGLNRIDPESGQIVVIRKTDGLYEEGLHKILRDDYGRLWFSTNRGVFWVEFSHLEEFASGHRNRIISTPYTERDGMLNREANGGYQNSGMRTADGRLWFTTQMGILVIDPAEIHNNQPLPQVIIEEVTASGETLVNQDGVIEIDPSQRSFTIHYNCPVFMAPERIRFRYKLDGFDTDWVDAGNRREAIYTNVPAGEYEFSVSAYFNSENTDTQNASVSLSVVPVFYETSWFALTVLILFFLILGGTGRIRLRQLLKREEELEKTVKERTEALRTEKKLTEAQAEKLTILDQEKNRFFANISHEFRTPLTLTIGPLQDLRNGLYGRLPPEAIDQVDLGIRNSRRLLRLVGQLLDLSRLQNNKFELNLKTGNVNRYLTTIAQPFIQAAGRKGVRFEIQVPEKPVFLMFDPGHFDKIVANLLSNAFKFTPEGGTVTFRLCQEGSEAVISIRDTGPGISKEHLPRLFDRFYQVQKSEMQPGTGIGLSLAKELTQLHGGTIHADSSADKGSVFTIRMPLIEKNGSESTSTTQKYEQAVETKHQKRTRGPDTNLTDRDEKENKQNIRKTILVVDDHADIRIYLKNHLKDEYNIKEAGSGNEALIIVESELPDLIISDVMMPDGDGFDLLKQIRGNSETDFLSVILLTARTEAEDKLSGLGIGANDYITKPFDINEVSVRIRNLFDQQMRLKHHFTNNNSANGKKNIHHKSVDVKSTGEVFLDSVKHEIQLHLSDEDFTVEELAKKINQSRSNLHRRLKKLTGETPSSMIRRIRLELGAQLLSQQAGTVSEIAYSTGFKSVAHFSRVFREQYNVTPTEYAEINEEVSR